MGAFLAGPGGRSPPSPAPLLGEEVDFMTGAGFGTSSRSRKWGPGPLLGVKAIVGEGAQASEVRLVFFTDTLMASVVRRRAPVSAVWP